MLTEKLKCGPKKNLTYIRNYLIIMILKVTNQSVHNQIPDVYF